MAATEKALGALHEAVAMFLADRIAGGEASASDVSNAIKMLKDNNITCAPGGDNAIDNLEQALSAARGVSPVDRKDLDAALAAMDFGDTRAN